MPECTFRESRFPFQKESTTKSRGYRKSPIVRKSPRGRRGRPRRIAEQAVAQAREVLLPPDVEALSGLTRAVFSSWAVELGLQAAQCRLADELDARLHAAYQEKHATPARTLLTATVKWLRTISSAAAASPEEGLDDTFTVVRLGVPELLRKTLATTNPIESAFSVAESVTSRVNHIKSHKHMPQLLTALEQLTAPKSLDVTRQHA